jgi:hypothetical protein
MILMNMFFLLLNYGTQFVFIIINFVAFFSGPIPRIKSLSRSKFGKLLVKNDNEITFI